MPARIRVKRQFDCFAVFNRRWAVKDRNSLLRPITFGNRYIDLLLKIALGVVVFGENNDSRIVPFCARSSEFGTHVLANPGDQPANASVWQSATGFGRFAHLIKQLLFLSEQFLSAFVACQTRRYRRHGSNFSVFLLRQVLLWQACAVVVCAETICNQIKLETSLGRCRRRRSGFPLFLHRAPMHAQRPGETFYRREHPLPQSADEETGS